MTLMRSLQGQIVIVATPSERLPRKLQEGTRNQHIRLDADALSDVVFGAWHVFICAPIQVGNLRQPPYSGQPSSMGEGMRVIGLTPTILGDKRLSMKKIENPTGIIRDWGNGTGGRFLRPFSKPRPPTESLVGNNVPNWPLKADGPTWSDWN